MAHRNYLSIAERSLLRLEELSRDYEVHEEDRVEYLDEIMRVREDFQQAMNLSELEIPETQREELNETYKRIFNRLISFQYEDLVGLHGGKKQ